MFQTNPCETEGWTVARKRPAVILESKGVLERLLGRSDGQPTPQRCRWSRPLPSTGVRHTRARSSGHVRSEVDSYSAWTSRMRRTLSAGPLLHSASHVSTCSLAVSRGTSVSDIGSSTHTRVSGPVSGCPVSTIQSDAARTSSERLNSCSPAIAEYAGPPFADPVSVTRQLTGACGRRTAARRGTTAEFRSPSPAGPGSTG